MYSKVMQAWIIFLVFSGDSEWVAGELKQIGVIRHPPIREASGLVKSHLHKGVFWTINDSGNPPHLFAIERTGKCLAEYRIKGAGNFDWEAITSDERGNLYIGDIGNNVIPGGLSKRWVYQIKEPAQLIFPEQGRTIPELPLEAQYSYTFPGQPFDAEAMYYDQKILWIISKVKKGTAGVYRMKLDEPGQTVQLHKEWETTSLPLVTDAALSANGRRLAICSYSYAVFLERGGKDPFAFSSDRKRLTFRFGPTQIEACCWDGDELILISEDRKIYSILPNS